MDLWSLGIIIFEIMFKRHPFNGENSMENIKAVNLRESLEDDEYITEEYIDFIEALLEPDPEKRTWDTIQDNEWLNLMDL